MPSILAVTGAAAPRLVVFASMWVVISGGSADSWLVGVPTVAAATAASLALRPARAGSGRLWLRPLALVRFGAFFAVQSLRGGLDVAIRAIDPRLPIAPGFAEFALRIPPGLARIFVVDVVSLLPGTLSVALDGDRLRIHRIDVRVDAEPAIRSVERHAAALFGLAPPAAATY